MLNTALNTIQKRKGRFKNEGQILKSQKENAIFGGIRVSPMQLVNGSLPGISSSESVMSVSFQPHLICHRQRLKHGRDLGPFQPNIFFSERSYSTKYVKGKRNTTSDWQNQII